MLLWYDKKKIIRQMQAVTIKLIDIEINAVSPNKGKKDAAFNEIKKILVHMKENGSIAPNIDTGGTGISSIGKIENPGLAFCKIWTHIATALERLLTDVSFSCRVDWIDLFGYYEQFHLVFSNSGYGSTDYLLRRVLVEGQGRDNEGLISFLYGPHSEMSVEQLFGVVRDPGWRLRVACWNIAVPCWINRNGHNIRNSFVRHFPQLLGEAVNSGSTLDLGLLYGAVWMYSSYSDDLAREKVHASINRLSELISRKIDRSKAGRSKKSTARDRSKYRILVVLEKFTSGHAMTRCYENMTRELADNSRVELIGLALTPESTDSYTNAIFDESITIAIDQGSNRTLATVQKVMDIIEQIRPDAIWYPSIGMSDSAAFLAALRLAPMQAMCYGHPSSTWSEKIDIAFVSEGHAKYVDRSIVSERLKTFDTSNMTTLMGEVKRQDLLGDWNIIRKNEHVPCFGISASAMKLNNRFIKTVSRIAKENSRLKFIFFLASHSAGQQFRYMEIEIKKIMGCKCVVMPSLPYAEYIGRLSECDFTITPSPFGHSNTFIDSLIAGAIPLSAPLHMDIVGANDRVLHEMAGLEQFCFNGEEELVDAAIRLSSSPMSSKDREAFRGCGREMVLRRMDLHDTLDIARSKAQNNECKGFGDVFLGEVERQLSRTKARGF